MAELMANSQIMEYDILAIQEPWRNPFYYTTYNSAKEHFDLVYNDHATTKVCFFINIRLQGLWTCSHHSPDYSSLSLKCKSTHSQDRTIQVHNVYNPSPS